MSQKLSASEQLAYTTVKIHCGTDSGRISTGTGCFFTFKFDENLVPVIITNRHVVKGASKGVFQLTRANSDGSPQIGKFDNILVNDFEKQWIAHPNPEIDLCMMFIGVLFNDAEKKGTPFFYKFFDETLILNPKLLSDLTASEEILMVGYPVGLWDSRNNMPLFRRGITATHPNINYEGKEEFLIDAACFPGSSGSPVLLYNLGNYTNRSGGTVIGSRVALLGILYAGPQYTVEGEIQVVPIPTQMKPVTSSKIPINIGIVIKANKILDFKPIVEKILNQNQTISE